MLLLSYERIRYMLALFSLVSSESEFRFFRCDACSATIHNLKEFLTEKTKHRKKPLSAVDLALLSDQLCTTETFDKRKYGVKEVGHDAYLFGPGVPSHVPKDVGFGQMGMGDYDHRLASFCRLFLDQFGEDALYGLFKRTELQPDFVCSQECWTDSSGSVGISYRDL